LYLVDVPGFLPFHHQGGAINLGGSCDVPEEGLTGLRGGWDRRFGDAALEAVQHLLCLIRLVERVRLLQQLVWGKPTLS
jgi:hypothetical protein